MKTKIQSTHNWVLTGNNLMHELTALKKETRPGKKHTVWDSYSIERVELELSWQSVSRDTQGSNPPTRSKADDRKRWPLCDQVPPFYIIAPIVNMGHTFWYIASPFSPIQDQFKRGKQKTKETPIRQKIQWACNDEMSIKHTCYSVKKRPMKWAILKASDWKMLLLLLSCTCTWCIIWRIENLITINLLLDSHTRTLLDMFWSF